MRGEIGRGLCDGKLGGALERSDSSIPTGYSRRIRLYSNPPPPTEIYTLSLHDALPISAMLQYQEVAEKMSTDLQECARKLKMAHERERIYRGMAEDAEEEEGGG